MPFALNFLPAPHAILRALLDDPDSQQLATAVEAVLDQLEADPGDPKLGTTHFTTSQFRHIRSTPVRRSDWVVIWQLAPALDRQIDVLFLGDPSA